MQQKRGSEAIDVPQVEEEAASTVLLRLGPSQLVETPNSSPGETVGRRVLGTDILYVSSKKMAQCVQESWKVAGWTSEAVGRACSETGDPCEE